MADEILVLQDGKIMERGKETELLATNGIYRRMRQLQQNKLALQLPTTNN
jgi:ATP-binding cassette subfamily B protein